LLKDTARIESIEDSADEVLHMMVQRRLVAHIDAEGSKILLPPRSVAGIIVATAKLITNKFYKRLMRY
jgi:hypothetical protein